MEEFFLNLGMSYTWSKIFPFVLMTILGILLAVFIHKIVYKKSWKIILPILGFLAPLGIYFSLHPIYEGDLNDASRSVSTEAATELNAKTLYVISLPGCPWCKLSIKDMEKLQERHPNLKISYVVVSTDENHLSFYKDEIPKTFSLELAKEPRQLAKVAQGEYPTFAIVEGNKILAWSNSEFGASAWDRINQIIK